MTRKKTEPNYELLFKSSVTALQTAYGEYKKVRVKEIRYSWFADDGTYTEMDCVRELRIKASEYLHDVERLKKEVEKYRLLVEGAEDAGRDE